MNDSLINHDYKHKAYISLGSNLGDRAGYLLLAVRGLLNAGFTVVRLSSIYETEPVDNTNQPAFLNMVAEITVDNFTPEQVLARLLRIEYQLGRRRDTTREKGARTIDLDLLLYASEIKNSEFLQLPHPRLHLRRFVLTPLAEIAPEIIHPLEHKTARELLQTLTDTARVEKWRAVA